ncbi:MAG: hypothetical protein LAQ30_21275 [Acidobacteriia bacterium]|nr:hypothetical protein [Terriglobia bacterium]
MYRSRVHVALTPAALLLLAGLAFPQGQPPVTPQNPAPAGTGGWRRVAGPPPGSATDQQNPEPVARDDNQQPAQDTPPPPASRPYDPPPYGPPSELTIKPGTYVTARVNEPLSSDRNQPGDPFSAVLMEPVVVDGVVVAQRGQSVYGRVAEAQKARSDSPSRLGLELTGLSLADGNQVPIRSQLISRQGGRTPAGDQASTVIATTATGAAIGAVAGWGTGALIGGGVGAIGGAVAVLLTRNHPTLVYPETALTFRIDAPVLVSTARAPQAFHYVGPEDYSRPVEMQARPGPPQRRPVMYPYPYPYPYYYPYPAWGPYWGPYYGVGVVIGRGGYYRRRW